MTARDGHGRRLLFVGQTRGQEGPIGHLATLAKAMADAGYEVAAVVQPGSFVRHALAMDGRIQLFPAPRDQGDVRVLRDVLRAARATRPDWIVGTLERGHWPLTAVSRVVGARLALFSHRDQRRLPWSALPAVMLAHRIVAPSEYHRRRLVEHGMLADRVAVLHHAVDATRFRIEPMARTEARLLLGFRPDDVVVGFVGPLERESGVEPLAEALRRAMILDPSIRALWAGQGDCESRLRACTERWGHADRHVWRPWCADPLAHYAALDLLALPSTGCEPFGRVLVEAQACGIPVVGSRTGGIPEAMEPGVTGLLLTPAHVAEWTTAILHLAGDASGRHRMGSVGREFVRRVFDARVIADEFGRLLDDAASRAWPRPR